MKNDLTNILSLSNAFGDQKDGLILTSEILNQLIMKGKSAEGFIEDTIASLEEHCKIYPGSNISYIYKCYQGFKKFERRSKKTNQTHFIKRLKK